MEQEILVKVEGLSKKFCKSLKKSLKYGMLDLYANLRGKPTSDDLRPDEFYALKDINFELRRGECLGLIGHNGAGKSTLLKILNGLINPDHGKVTMRGRVGALIELGAGFNPIMTGRENIYNNGAVLGFSKEEIDGKVEEIIEFAELREFIDMPVRNYSSGMKVRLGFSVAAQMEPDVLIIDEVLAVGDAGFRGKCYQAIGELSKTCAVIFVSHSMPMVARVCQKTILLKSGEIQFNGKATLAIEKYYDNFNSANSVNPISNEYLFLNSIDISSDASKIIYGQTQDFTLNFDVKKVLKNVELNLVFLSRELVPVAQINSKFKNQIFSLEEGLNQIKLTIENIQLTPGTYSLSIAVTDSQTKEIHLWNQGVKDLKIIGMNDEFGSAPYIMDASWE